MDLKLNETQFKFSILPLKENSDGYWANICLSIDNKNISVELCGEYLTRDELKRLISAMGLLLKGKITKKYSLDSIEPGLEIDLIPNVALDIMSKEQRETADCRMEFEILTRDEKTRAWSNASVLLRLSRKEIEKLYDGLKEEYDSAFAKIQETSVLPCLLVCGETATFCLSIVDYEFGSFKGKRDWDDDWLEIMVEFNQNGQKYTYTDPALLTVELEGMILELEGLLHIDKGEYHSDFIEPYFALNAFKDGERFEVEVKFFNDPSSDDYNWENTETYAREICDKTEFVKKIYSLKAMLEAFPKRDGKQRKKALITANTPYVENCDYLYVGVSPKGQYGCNYWYVDEAKRTQENTYVWVNMGRRNTEQIVYVDSIRYCNADDVPYPIEKTKRVIRQATEEETEEADVLWDE